MPSAPSPRRPASALASQTVARAGGDGVPLFRPRGRAGWGRGEERSRVRTRPLRPSPRQPRVASRRPRSGCARALARRTGAKAAESPPPRCVLWIPRPAAPPPDRCREQKALKAWGHLVAAVGSLLRPSAGPRAGRARAEGSKQGIPWQPKAKDRSVEIATTLACYLNTGLDLAKVSFPELSL
ncbi:uncharacterized protein PHA67_022094 isoform 2-T2 [Liasis olivaceus]